jgi:DNA topoisomerase-2
VQTSEPKVKEFSGEEFTRITFSPDLAKFNMERLDDDHVALLSRRYMRALGFSKIIRIPLEHLFGNFAIRYCGF